MPFPMRVTMNYFHKSTDTEQHFFPNNQAQLMQSWCHYNIEYSSVDDFCYSQHFITWHL